MLGTALSGLIGCRRCTRLADYMAALPPKRGFCRSDYWNGPVPGFGDPEARIALIGLAPGAHGANRTGRPFTGDGAGDFMYPLLYRSGFTSRPDALRADDGLELRDLYITNAVKCVPPDNKPTPAEFACCRPYLSEELATLSRLRVVVTLGQGAFTSVLRLLQAQDRISRIADFPFAHGAVFELWKDLHLLASYHTSRYNIQTRRLTEGMFLDLLSRVKRLAAGENG